MDRFGMLQTLILAGKYEREDMEMKISKYLSYGKLTQAEADYLISLMDAREIVTK